MMLVRKIRQQLYMSKTRLNSNKHYNFRDTIVYLFIAAIFTVNYVDI